MRCRYTKRPASAHGRRARPPACPPLADAVPDYTDCVSIFADADKPDRSNAAELAERLNARGIFAEVMPSSEPRHEGAT